VLLLASIAGLFLLPAPWNVIGVCVAALLEVGEIWVYRKYLSRFRVQGGAEGMVGERAEVIERCDPDGRAKVRGEIWAARAEDGALEAGARARVEAVEGLTVVLAADVVR
jgi:membrane protein implicated in regulation of membrane protease activity